MISILLDSATNTPVSPRRITPGDARELVTKPAFKWALFEEPINDTSTIPETVIDPTPVTSYDAPSNTWRETYTKRDRSLAEQCEARPITFEQWQTLVFGLPAQHKTAIANAISTGLAAAAAASGTDGAFKGAKLQGRAAKYLQTDETKPIVEGDRLYSLIIAALAAVGIVLTGPQTTALQNRWLAAAAL